jgi:hypothetical protein
VSVGDRKKWFPDRDKTDRCIRIILLIICFRHIVVTNKLRIRFLDSFRNYYLDFFFKISITVNFSRRLMNSKRSITLGTTVLAAVALLFASLPLGVTQANAYWGGGWGWVTAGVGTMAGAGVTAAGAAVAGVTAGGSTNT